MKKIPTAIMMSGKGTNAFKIIEEKSPNLDIRLIFSDNPLSNAKNIATVKGLEFEINDIYKFCGVGNAPDKLTGDDRIKLKNKELRKQFDLNTSKVLKKYGIELIATAGYDWVMDAILPATYVIVNVHPGDLRKRNADGKPLYAGLRWIPTAKAILNGEEYAYTSTHLITPELDGGPIARISSPVMIVLPAGINKDNILPAGITLKDVIKDIDYNHGKIFGNSTLYTHSKSVQEKLKERGDWVEFPLTMHVIGEYMLNDRFTRNEKRELYLDGKSIQHGFLMNVK